jgi:predicted short-subunit dehydrogenase-like oxidoreductase (DUF2520 family)
MSERMAVAVIGQGSLGRALSAALAREGAEVWPVEARSIWPDLRGASIIVLAVRDDVIGEVAARLGPVVVASQTVLHCSGARSAAEALAPLVGRVSVGTLHPLRSVTEESSFGGAAFAVEGEAARALAERLGGVPFFVPPDAMPLYHAAAVFAANYVVALLDVAVRLAERAGLDEPAARAALVDLAASALANVRRMGAADALTGPIARGDEETVRRHLAALPADVRPLYEALASETRRLAARRALTSS